MTDTTTTLPLSIPQTEHSVIKHWPSDAEAEIQLSCPRVTQTINWLGGLPKQRDFDGWIDGNGKAHVVYPPDDMSGSISRDDYLTFAFTNLGPRGMGGGFSPDIIILDEADHYDKRMKDIMGPTFVISDHCRPYYEETAQASQMFAYKMAHDIPYEKHLWMPPAHKPGETPRGTKPRFIGGQKKSKQQRAAMKARRKQR